MTTDLIDLWGNFFNDAVKSQKQLMEMSEMSRRAFTGFVEWSATFQKLYGIESPMGVNPWGGPGSDYQKSFFQGFFKFWGIEFFTDEHLELIRKYEALKEKLALQEESVKHLKVLLEEANRAKLELQAQANRALAEASSKQKANENHQQG